MFLVAILPILTPDLVLYTPGRQCHFWDRRLTNRLTNQLGLTISLNTTRTSSLVVKNERICLCLKDSRFCGVGSSWGWSAGAYSQLTECCNGSLVTSSAKLCRGFLYFLNPTKLFLIYFFPLPAFSLDIFIQTTTKHKHKRESEEILSMTYPISLVVYHKGCSFNTFLCANTTQCGVKELPAKWTSTRHAMTQSGGDNHFQQVHNVRSFSSEGISCFQETGKFTTACSK